MKILLYILILLCLGALTYNLTFVNFTNPLQEDSRVALIGTLASGCALLLLLILLVSKQIEQKSKKLQ